MWRAEAILAAAEVPSPAAEAPAAEAPAAPAPAAPAPGDQALTAPSPEGVVIGASREGREIRAFRLGRGATRVSLLAGCHADEPVGPRLLRKLIAYLSALGPDDDLRTRFEWWILPHINPDGEVRNRGWQLPGVSAYDLAAYLTGACRELPGEDIEFGFPRGPQDSGARPENRAALEWWRSARGPFALHVSLHGMAVAAGPWFLIDEAWRDRCERLKRACSDRVAELGYLLHDVERRGEKGFVRLGRGFCTRPDSRRMSSYFRTRGDERTAALFRPSSMETLRGLGGDPLTLVSEMPLFLTPGVGETLGPPDPVALEWRVRLERWREALLSAPTGEHGEVVAARVRAEAESDGLRPMPVDDQMRLQWALIHAGLEQTVR